MTQARKRFRKGGAVAVSVEADAAGYVDSFRRRYDPHVAHIMPHITLAFAHDLETVQWSQARPRIERDLQELPPFTVHVAETGVFVRDGLVLWLRPTVENGELISLRSVVVREFPGVTFERPDDFVPHISIGFFETEESLLRARAVVQRELRPFSFRVAFVSFLQADEGDIWRCVDSIKLGGSEARPSYS